MERSLENEFQDIKQKIFHAYMENNKLLKPCPFCGSSAAITAHQINDEDDYAWWRATITCDNCGCTFKDDHTYCDRCGPEHSWVEYRRSLFPGEIE